MVKDAIQQLDPFEFEKLIADIWESFGYETDVRPQSRDRGIDIVAIQHRPFHQKQLIQAKRYSKGNTVGSADVRKYATLYQQVPDTDVVVIVTSNQFTKDAEQLADDLDVVTVNGEDVSDLIEYNKNDIGIEDIANDSMATSNTGVSDSQDIVGSCPSCGRYDLNVEDGGYTATCTYCGENHLVSYIKTSN